MVSTWDARTDIQIKSMAKSLRQRVSDAINEVEKQTGIRLRVTEGMRSVSDSNKGYQAYIASPLTMPMYAIGGSSYHNYGAAFDVAPIVDNGRKVDYSLLKSNPKIARIIKSYGFTWGGDWTSKDYPHFQEANTSIELLKKKEIVNSTLIILIGIILVILLASQI